MKINRVLGQLQAILLFKRIKYMDLYFFQKGGKCFSVFHAVGNAVTFT